MATKINPTETRPLTYRTEALKSISRMLSIPPTRISKFFGYTNNTTVNRWMDGNDIYIASLLFICNTCKLDLLSFFTHDERPFQTNLGDIIAMEKAGLNLRDLLREKGVTPCAFSESRSLSETIPHDKGYMDEYTKPAPDENKEPKHTAATSVESLPSNFIDKIVALQCQAHEHERQMLEQQRRDMQTIIDEKDKQIAKLEKELKRLRVIERASKTYMGIVADDSSATE